MPHQPFLNNPDEFPDPDEIISWGDKTIIIDFIGGPYRFSGLSEPQALALQSRFGDCCIPSCEENSTVINTRIAQIDESVFREIDRANGYVYEHIDYSFKKLNVEIVGQYFTANLDLDNTLSATMWTPLNEHPWFPGIVFENFFRNVVAYRLLELGGVLLHSACMVNHDKKAWLFVGNSGAGKSSIAEICSKAGYSILSDDLNAIVPDGDKLYVEKVPFSGTFRRLHRRGSRYPLETLCRIVKDKTNYLEPISNGEMLALMIANSPFINQDRIRQDELLANHLKVMQRCHSTTLHFNLDGKFTELFA